MINETIQYNAARAYWRGFKIHLSRFTEIFLKSKGKAIIKKKNDWLCTTSFGKGCITM